MSRYEELEAFVRTIEAGSFTRAAKQLGVAKSNISRRINELEARLGAQLITRTTRKLSLTESGDALFRRAKSLLADWNEAESVVSDQQTALSGMIRIAAPLSFGVHHLSDALLEFQSQHVEITYDIYFSDRRVDLIAEGVDLAIRIGKLESSTLIARKLSPIMMVAAASPDLFQDKPIPQKPDDLLTFPELRYRYRPQTSWTFTGQNGKTQTIEMEPLFTATNGGFLTQAALSAKGIVIQPSFIMHKELEDGRLIQLLPDYDLEELGLYAVYPPTRHLSRRVRDLIDFLSDYCGKEPYWDAWRQSKTQ